ncbi:hypothetical protein SAY87_002100 [Trapa incisa]|uniref:Uncharacterized protein n=1 Tax=Trapa incisa TaxID=236973 RepID=A0AAN7JTK6_9MYRT|nr:hypothetical protein SAY87_002100 [Trapa incisa]
MFAVGSLRLCSHTRSDFTTHRARATVKFAFALLGISEISDSISRLSTGTKNLIRLVLALMALKLHQLKSKATQLSQVASKHGTAYYRQLLEENKQYIQEPPTVEKCSLLAKQLFYTRLASIPQRTEAFRKELDCVKHAWKSRKDLKVEDAGIAALFSLECFAWFCAGEIIGRGFTFTGYYV